MTLQSATNERQKQQQEGVWLLRHYPKLQFLSHLNSFKLLISDVLLKEVCKSGPTVKL